ncbi:MAG: hypothetical protein F6K47_01670 [Symploca sp. SIO2E6]|nr:hypothetical protein [Symploca sp. SIO2E6]
MLFVVWELGISPLSPNFPNSSSPDFSHLRVTASPRPEGGSCVGSRCLDPTYIYLIILGVSRQ